MDAIPFSCACLDGSVLKCKCMSALARASRLWHSSSNRKKRQSELHIHAYLQRLFPRSSHGQAAYAPFPAPFAQLLLSTKPESFVPTQPEYLSSKLGHSSEKMRCTLPSYSWKMTSKRSDGYSMPSSVRVPHVHTFPSKRAHTPSYVPRPSMPSFSAMSLSLLCSQHTRIRFAPFFDALCILSAAQPASSRSHEWSMSKCSFSAMGFTVSYGRIRLPFFL